MSVRRPLVYLVIFIVVTAFVTTLLGVSIAGYDGRSSRSWHAEFTDATKLQAGDDVRIAGVKVGRVSAVKLDAAAHAMVTFTVQDDIALTTDSTAVIRYRNLIGERYVALDVPPSGGALANRTIALDHTKPALDLTAVFDGFRPLFQGLDARSINALSLSLVQALQGEGGTLAQLLDGTGSLGATVAQHDRQIGALVTNLNAVLTELNDRTTAFTGLVGNLQSFTAQLAQTRTADLDALASIDQLADATDVLLTDARPGLAGSVAGIQAIAQQLADNQVVLDQKLKLLPTKLNAVMRAAQYGSWFQFFNCGIGLRVEVPGGQPIDSGANGPGTGICGG